MQYVENLVKEFLILDPRKRGTLEKIVNDQLIDECVVHEN